jgi:DNA-binding CsgD family transcriptional regulator
VAKNHDAAEVHLVAALDLATTCDVPFERALTLLSLAQLRFVTGLPDIATLLLDEIRGICGPLDVRPTLARVDALAARLTSEPSALDHPAGLTQREVEVLSLLPRGHSNAQIAEALFVSPRTVQTHLSNLYAKLGVSGRAEAVAYAVGHGLV